MNSKASFVMGLMIGAACGCLIARGYFKDKYAKQAQEEIDSVIEVFGGRKKEAQSEETNAQAEPAKEEEPAPEEKAAYRDLAGKYYSAPEDSDIRDVYKPYVIAPEEFGVKDGYDTVSLTYFADGTLADDMDRAMSDADIDATIGKGALSCFGMHEEDSVHVRNDRTKCDYEILMDLRSYEQVLEERPYIARE